MTSSESMGWTARLRRRRTGRRAGRAAPGAARMTRASRRSRRPTSSALPHLPRNERRTVEPVDCQRGGCAAWSARTTCCARAYSSLPTRSSVVSSRRTTSGQHLLARQPGRARSRATRLRSAGSARAKATVRSNLASSRDLAPDAGDSGTACGRAHRGRWPGDGRAARADPDVRPGGRYRQRTDAAERGTVPHAARHVASR